MRDRWGSRVRIHWSSQKRILELTREHSDYFLATTLTGPDVGKRFLDLIYDRESVYLYGFMTFSYMDLAARDLASLSHN